MQKAVLGMAFLLTPLSLMAAEFSAENLAQAKALAEKAGKSELAYQLDESLSTEVGPRRVGTPGDKAGIEWAVAKMKALGFDRVWTETVTTPGWERGDISVEAVSPFPQRMVAIALGGSVPTPADGIEAQVVAFPNLDALKAAEAGSLKGKIAYIGYQMKPSIDGADYGVAGKQRYLGSEVAASKGASAVLIRSVGTDNDRIGHTGAQGDKSTIPAAALSIPDADLLESMMKRSDKVTLKINISSRKTADVKTANVIGEVTGTERPEDFVVLGSHLDSWDVGTGAVDDGMGVAITMAAAKHIIDSGKKPKRSIRVILFGAEEIGLYGVKQYYEKHKDKLGNHIIGAEWDSGTRMIHQLRPGVGEKSLAAIKQMAELLKPYGVALHPSNSAKGQSDISVLGKAGMPAINFDSDLTDYFDYHHTENDTMANVPPETMRQASAVYTAFAWLTANSLIDFRK
ncbi:M20/M25/M40 family metallo-hydrolase [Pseudoteredinibacter isoporae]|nr:M20/M25/M40 family metallo-hydrolase [Pseudoteredinibacter isoporae]